MARYLFLVLLAAFATFPTAAFPAELKEPADTVERMAGEVIGHFPRAEGKVTSAEGHALRFDIGAADGLKPGMDIFLFRPGKPIRHPVTKAVLGNREESLGRAVVTDVGDNESGARLEEILVTRIIPGDVGRLSTEKDKLLLAVYGKDYNELVLTRLITQLKDSGRFDLLGPVDAEPGKDLDAGAVKGLITVNGAEVLLALRTTPTTKPDRTKVEIVLYSSEGAALETQGGVVDVTSEVYGETVMDYQLVKGEHRDFYRVENLPYRGKHIAAGRITGGDATEVAVSDGTRLTVYRFEEGALRELWREEGSALNRQLALECADLNKNGKDEIYVTNFAEDNADSYVMEYDGTAFRAIAEHQPVFFRVLDVPGSGTKLIGSSKGTDTPYSGVIREYRWEGGNIVKAGELGLPGKIKDPYGFVLADIIPDKGAAADRQDKKGPMDGLEIVWVDDADYLQILDMEGKRLWKSKERYGGYVTFFEPEEKAALMPNVDARGKVKGKLIVRDDPEGGKEIVVTRNLAMTYSVRRFRGYSGAEIHSLAWNGAEMEDRWSIMNIEGYLADIYMGDAVNNGRTSILILTDPTYKTVKASKTVPLGSVASITASFADRSTLLVYKVPQR